MLFDNMIKKDVERQTRELEEWLEKQSEEVAFPKDIEMITDVPYMLDYQTEHLMDIYRQVNHSSNLPVIINIHGGGLMLGSKEFNRLFCAYLANLGYLVFCVEYPLIPHVEVYEQYRSLSRALDKIEELLETYHGDKDNVYLTGDSAGAYLSIYVTAMQKSPLLTESANVQPSRLPIKALGLISGMFYTTKKDKIGLFLPKYIYGKNWRHCSFKPYTDPEHQEIISHLPPCFLITTKNDFLRHYTLNYYQALVNGGVKCQLLDYPKHSKLNHAFVVFSPEYKESQEAILEMIRFFQTI